MAEQMDKSLDYNVKQEAKIDATRKLRIGIIGCGGIAHAHLNSYKQMPDVEIVAGCDIIPGKAAAFFKEFGIKKVENLVTAWDTFDPLHPGKCERCVSEKTGKTIYDIPEDYKEFGMYLYEVRKEYDEEAEKEITFDELIGKVLLVGITYYTHDNEFIEQKQFYGTVTEANEDLIRVKQKDGTDFTLPPDLSSTKRARQGEYKLRSTGEVVVNPDFLATWNLNRAKED